MEKGNTVWVVKTNRVGVAMRQQIGRAKWEHRHQAWQKAEWTLEKTADAPMEAAVVEKNQKPKK